MLVLKAPQKIGSIIIVTLLLFSILLAEPVSARKSRPERSKADNKTRKTQRVEKPSTAAGIQQPSSVVKRDIGAAGAAGTNRSQNRESISRPQAGQSPLRRTFNFIRSRQPNRTTQTRPVTVQPQSVDKSRSATTMTEKRPTVKPQSRISPDKTSRIGSSIGERKTPSTVMRKPLGDSRRRISISKTWSNIKSKISRKPRVVGGDFGKSSIIGQKRKMRNHRVDADDQKLVRTGRTVRGGKLHRARRTSKVVYEDRPHTVRHIHHHQHVYRDRHDRLCHRIVWPRYYVPVYYRWGPRIRFCYVYPYYHRKYIFVSLDGFWPVGYTYIRYYWYPCHAYFWYGYYPIAREVRGDTYNYYTYNYYYSDGSSEAQYSQAADGIRPVDHTTFADVREKLAQQAQQPSAKTLADTYFEDAVKAFEDGDYAAAADKLAQAMELAPEDMILPFAYVQALFADERDVEAARVLRLSLEKASPEEQGVFYPRGLYADEEVLFEQIERLAEKAELYPFNCDLQLLLGYQLLGIGEIEEAVEPLERASQDTENAVAATVLLELLEKIRADNAESGL